MFRTTTYKNYVVWPKEYPFNGTVVSLGMSLKQFLTQQEINREKEET